MARSWAFSIATKPAVSRGPIRFLCSATDLVLFFPTVWAFLDLVTSINQSKPPDLAQ
jgi:hypothetical protein